MHDWPCATHATVAKYGMRAGRCGANPNPNPNPNLSATPAGPHAIVCAGVVGVVFLYTGATPCV